MKNYTHRPPRRPSRPLLSKFYEAYDAARRELHQVATEKAA